MASRSMKLAGQDATLELWIFTLVGAVLQVYLSLLQIYNNTFQLRTVGFSIPLVSDGSGLLVPLTIPLAYTLFWSSKLRRLVSPINVQLLALAIATILIANDLIAGPNGFPTIFQRASLFVVIPLFLIEWSLGASILLAFGIVQLLVVRWAVGRNLEEELDVVTYSINADLTTVSKIIDSGRFEHTWHFNRKPAKMENIRLLSRRDAYGTERLVMAIGQDQEIENNSILAMVAYDIRFYSLEKSDEASGILDSILNDFKGKLEASNPSIKLDLLSAQDNPVSSEAYAFAIRPTRSKLDIAWETWRKFPKYHKMLFATLVSGLAIDIVALAVGFSFQIVGFPYDTTITVGIILFLGIVIDLAQSLRSELSQRKRESQPVH